MGEKENHSNAKFTFWQTIIVALIGGIVSILTVIINKQINKPLTKNELTKELIERLVTKNLESVKTKELIEKSTRNSILNWKTKTPVGTIIASTLDFSKFSRATNDSSIFNPTINKWSPADGRSISNSGYHTLTGNSRIPDLRGQFLRGKNEFLIDGMQPNNYANGIDPDINNRLIKNGYSYQKDKVGKHKHIYRVHYHTSKGGNSASGSNSTGSESKPETEFYNSNETRPKNMNVYYYIKINN